MQILYVASLESTVGSLGDISYRAGRLLSGNERRVRVKERAFSRGQTEGWLKLSTSWTDVCPLGVEWVQK